MKYKVRLYRIYNICTDIKCVQNRPKDGMEANRTKQNETSSILYLKLWKNV